MWDYLLSLHTGFYRIGNLHTDSACWKEIARFLKVYRIQMLPKRITGGIKTNRKQQNFGFGGFFSCLEQEQYTF